MSTTISPEIAVSGIDIVITEDVTDDTRENVALSILSNYQSAIDASNGALLLSISSEVLKLNTYVDPVSNTPIFTKLNTLLVSSATTQSNGVKALTVTSAQAAMYNIYSPIVTGSTLQIDFSESIITNSFTFNKLDEITTRICVFANNKSTTPLLCTDAVKGDIVYVKNHSDGTAHTSSVFTSDTFMTIAIGSVTISVNDEQYVPTETIEEPTVDPNRGIMPPAGYVQDKSFAEYVNVRKIVTRAWNTSYPAQLGPDTKAAQSSFRLINNAGDVLSRKNYSCKKNGDGCDASGVPAAACNTKFVYDGSDYIRFKKQVAHNKNYNDVSAGGARSLNQITFKIV